jgi:hypothetical protein
MNLGVLGPSMNRRLGRSLTVTATPWRPRILSGLRPLTPPPQPRQPGSLTARFGNRDGAHEAFYCSAEPLPTQEIER